MQTKRVVQTRPEVCACALAYREGPESFPCELLRPGLVTVVLRNACRFLYAVKWVAGNHPGCNPKWETTIRNISCSLVY